MAMQPGAWRLDTADTTLLLTASDAKSIPQIAWFGHSLGDEVSADTLCTMLELPVPQAKLDKAEALSVLPQLATGLDTTPALRGHRNGSAFAQQFELNQIEVREGVVSLGLTAQAAELEINMQFSLHALSGVLSINTTLTNTGTTAFTVDWLASASVPLPEQHTECLYLTGRWGLEFQQNRQTIGSGRILLENNRGRTSHELYPGIVSGATGFSELTGDVIAAQLAWSGSHRTVIEQLSDGRKMMQSGVSLDPGELILAPGASHATPVLHVARGEGVNHVSQSMHHYARTEILPPWTRTPRPVHANSWEALYFDHDIDKLKALIDAAAKLGAERFVLDDGWFNGRRSDTAGLGDWYVDSGIYPDGLHPIVNYTRRAGLQFGLWFEPEMVNPDSDLYREKPQWVLHLKDVETPLARNQLILNLERDDVQDYLYERIASLVDEYRIDYIKWDFNRDLVLAGDGQQSRMQQQPRGSYRLLKRLNQQFPALEIETCSSGGARADWGVLAYTGRVWTSDTIDAIDRVAIQRGYSIFNPPEIMGAHIGHEHAHLTGRTIDLHTRAIVALQGQLGFEVDARNLPADELAQLKHYVAIYKKHRFWLADSKTFRLDCTRNHLLQSGLVSADRQHSLWFVIATHSLEQTTPGKLIPVGLAKDKLYKVSLASNNAEYLRPYSKHIPDWIKSTVTVRGDVLMGLGLMLPIMPAQSALLLDISYP